MSTRDLILSIDFGTQSVRALIFDVQGNLLLNSQAPIQPYFSTEPGRAEQKPELFWETLCQACQGLWNLMAKNPQAGLSKDRIAGAALTTQRSTVINLDRNGAPLRPAIVWLDQRRTEGLPPLGGLWGLAFKAVGMSRTVAYLQAEAEANWIAANQPEIWKNTYKYVYLSGYLTLRLTDRWIDSVGCQVGYMPFDYKKKRWASSWDWKWQVLPINPDILMELRPPSAVLGEITSEASQATGIPAGLPLIAAASDKACEVIGAGCLEPNVGCISYGTASTINTTHKRYVEVIPLIPPYPSAVPNAYSLECQIYRGFWMVSWFIQEFGLHERSQAAEKGIVPEDLLDDLLNSVPPGSDGLVLQPYWSPGLRVPGPEARGAIIGFGDVHTRAHLYRAILEGVAYALREGAERTSRRSKIPINELRVVGGGSRSRAAMQITADVFGLPASRPHIFEASGLGAAIVAAVGLGLQPDFEHAIASMTRLRDTFAPDEDVHRRYDDLYQNIYLQMYNQLKPLYDAMFTRR